MDRQTNGQTNSQITMTRPYKNKREVMSDGDEIVPLTSNVFSSIFLMEYCVLYHGSTWSVLPSKSFEDIKILRAEHFFDDHEKQYEPRQYL